MGEKLFPYRYDACQLRFVTCREKFFEVFGEVRGMKIPYPTVIAQRAKTMQERVREGEVGRKVVSIQIRRMSAAICDMP